MGNEIDLRAAFVDRPGDEDFVEQLVGILDGEEHRGALPSMAVLDGFVTALTIGPVEVSEEEWLPALFGDGVPDLGDAEMLERLVRFVRYYYVDQKAFLRAAPGRWEPWIMDDDDPVPEAEEWAKGFVAAVGLRETAWQPILEDDFRGAAFIGILSLVGLSKVDDEDDDGLSAEDRAELEQLDAMRGDLAEQLPAMVTAIHEFWHGKGKPPIRRMKVGRNEACPCGSGKKYKRCCGA